MITRKRLIASVMAAAMFTMSVAMGQSQGPVKGDLAGSWRVTVTLGPNRPPNAPETVEALATYDSSGGYLFTDNDPGPAGHGSWESAGHRRFNATHLRFLLDPMGHLFATLRVRARITLGPNSDEFTTREKVEIRLFPSDFLLASYDGATSVGRRIRVEPIE